MGFEKCWLDRCKIKPAKAIVLFFVLETIIGVVPAEVLFFSLLKGFVHKE